jgi:OmcA/MtrC family decaheme c-type cytochrome
MRLVQPIALSAQHFYLLLHFVLFLCLAFMTVACGNDGRDGAAGATGPAGPPSDIPSSIPSKLTVNISSVTIETNPVVNFSIIDQDGEAYSDLTAPRFMIAKLQPGTNGNPSQWRSYLNRIETANGIGPGTNDTTQATQESNGELINHGAGNYTYIFANNIKAITTPIAVTYEPNLTHRLAIQISGNNQPVTNVAYTWRPSNGAISEIFSRDIVKLANCNSCHDDLAIHGGGRKDPKMCVTCHNPGSSDANSGNTLDFNVLIHKIHRGANLPSVIDGQEYAIWGFRDSKHDYSSVHLPMDIRNCSKCHDASDSETPNAPNWFLKPTLEACGSCHDDVDFELGIEGGHAGGVMDDNSGCTICHREGGFAGSVIQSHQIGAQIASSAFKYNILDVRNTEPGNFPEITFSVTNPESENTHYNILSDPEFTAGGGASRLAIDIAWNTKDYINDGTGAGVARTVSINALSSAVDNSDGTYSVTSSINIPATQVGSGAIAIEGHPAVDLNQDGVYSDSVPVKGAVDYFSITDNTPQQRRQVVSIEKCQACHVNINFHGNNRNDKIELCVMCHNPSNTDFERRPASPADGLAEQTIDMKYMIHAIHAGSFRQNPYILYGFGGSEHDFSQVHYPGKIKNCQSCHLDSSFEIPLAASVQSTTIATGSDISSREDDIKITPTAAVCSSCHDDHLSKAHMVQNGGAAFDTSQLAIDSFEVVETCVFCHGSGKSEDVTKVHGIE